MLDPWAFSHSRWKKRLVWHGWERRALERAGALHALCPAEAASLRALGLTAPIAVIPNGVLLPAAAGANGAGAGPLPPPPWAEQVPEGERVLLFLSRFHAKKGLEPLLQAWASLGEEPRRRGWWLALVGYGDDGALAARVERTGPERVLVHGPCFGAAKEACLAAASAFVLPSFSEGLPMAALEAMAHRLPCLLSPACNLPEAYDRGAATAVEPEATALGGALRQLLQQPAAELAAMGDAGRQLVAERFSWQQVAERTAGLYGWLHGAGERPDWIEVPAERPDPVPGW
jgi:poly(glycerol-phosphate) alpha-glucosyltransferase